MKTKQKQKWEIPHTVLERRLIKTLPINLIYQSRDIRRLSPFCEQAFSFESVARYSLVPRFFTEFKKHKRIGLISDLVTVISC